MLRRTDSGEVKIRFALSATEPESTICGVLGSRVLLVLDCGEVVSAPQF